MIAVFAFVLALFCAVTWILAIVISQLMHILDTNI